MKADDDPRACQPIRVALQLLHLGWALRYKDRLDLIKKATMKIVANWSDFLDTMSSA